MGEMKELSVSVTDNVSGLNRILSNVKARGTWAEKARPLIPFGLLAKVISNLPLDTIW